MTRPSQPEPILRWEWVLLALCVVVGLALRVGAAARAPGLWYDEAIYGLDAIDVWRKPGYWPVFFDRENHMREPLYMYFLAAGLWANGVSVFTIRGVSALIGTATIPVFWLLAREWRGRLFAAAAVVFFVVFRWHLHFSGLAFRTITSPLLAATTMYFLLRLLRTGARRDALLCGLSLGIGAYTYLSFRLFPFIVAVPMAAALWQAWQQGREAAWQWLLRCAEVVAVAGLVFVPLGLDFLRHPDHFRGRAGEVNFLHQEGAAVQLLRQTRDVFLMPAFRGDHVGKHNLPGPPQFLQSFPPAPERVLERWREERLEAKAAGRPVHDPHGTGMPVFGLSLGLLFYVGFALLLRGAWKDPADVAVASWLVVGSLASILSFGAPNMLRLLYLSPAMLLVALLPLTLLLQGPVRRWLPLVAGLFLLHAATDLRRLWLWPTHPMVPPEFNAELAEVGTYLARQPDRLPVLLPFEEQPTLTFIADGTRFNPPVEELGERWWELRTVPPFPELQARGEPFTGCRTQEIMHPQGLLFGTLVEVQAPRP